MQSPPVAHHPSLEAHVLLQISVQEIRIATGMHSVDEVIGAHEAGCSSVDTSLEGGVVHFLHGSFIGHAVDSVSMGLLAVQGKVLGNSQDALRLHTFNIGLRHASTKIGRLSRDILAVAPATSDAVHVDSWSKDDIGALRKELLSEGHGPVVGGLLVPRRSNRQCYRPSSNLLDDLLRDSSEALTVVLHVEGWDTVLAGTRAFACVLRVESSRISDVVIVHDIPGVVFPAETTQKLVFFVPCHRREEGFDSIILASLAPNKVAVGVRAREALPRGSSDTRTAGVPGALDFSRAAWATQG
mmetsp:Transcript_1721/g.3798  ORF Transcript_1721/g.3798 Transcript_1721/m.3798 type:complete len:299 (+) Transcript_1721:1450-2346(+)